MRKRTLKDLWGAWNTPATYLGIALVALLLRVIALDGFVTHDEAEFWIDRSETFLLALQAGDYRATAVSTHPGVTTMWLGVVGIFLRRLLRVWQVVQEVPFPLLLALMRLPVALTHTAGIVVGYHLLRRMLPAGVALLAALLWAADPFVIGYSRLLHVDALLATFATLSLLAACVYWLHEPRRRWLVLSAVSAALAVLSKSPGLALLPLVALLATGAVWQQERRLSRHFVGVLVGPLLVWGAVFVLAIVVVWPAVWADPLHVYHMLRVGVEVEGASAHMTGNFFLGRETPAPGPLFYPVALAMRMTPITLAGVLLLALLLSRSGRGVWGEGTSADLAVLAAWVVLFTIAMSVFPKKFNRYLVPVFPAVDILAAVGLAWAAQRARQVLSTLHAPRSTLDARLPLLAVALAAVINAAWYHPYAIAYFNQVLGGPQMGARVFSVGWGEGFGQVAAWLNQQEDITGVVTASIMIKTLNPYLRHGAQATTPPMEPTLPDDVGYIVVSIYQAQGTVFPPFDQFYGREPPLHTVTIHGVDYAWIYQVAPPVEHERRATFGTALHLRGYRVEHGPQPGQPLVLKLFWQVSHTPPTDYWLFAHLIGPDGKRAAQVDVPYPTSDWSVRRYVTTELPIALPADAPAGEYCLYIGLYDPAAGQRLALEEAHPSGVSEDGPNSLLLTRVAVE